MQANRFLSIALVALCGCAAQPTTQAPKAPPLGQPAILLADFLAGTFVTIPQERGQGDSTKIELHVARVWPELESEAWLYFEFATPEDRAHPFRQELLRLRGTAIEFQGDLFRLEDRQRWVGEWSKPKPFASLDRARLREDPRCQVIFLRNMETLFTGGVAGNACPGETPGAAYRKSDYYVGSASIRYWDHEFDAAGRQVSGPSGPWEFRKTAR